MTAMKWQLRACLCGGTDHEPVSDRDRNGEALQTVLCTGCGHVFTNPAPDAAEMASYYQSKYREEYKGQTAPKLKHVYRAGVGALNRFARLRPYLFTDAKVIDVGAGGGEFVYLLAKMGFGAVGVEPHQGYAGYAREAYGISVRAGTLETTELPSNTADAIAIHHVLEHTVDPMAALRQLWTWLKPGGVLVVEVPNVATLSHAPRRRFHRAHLHTFNKDGLQDAVRNAGFTIIDVTPVVTGGHMNGGHINIVARKTGKPPAATWHDASAAVRSTLAAHTSLAHVLSGRPFRRLWINLTRPLREISAIAKLGNPSSGRALLDRLYASHAAGAAVTQREAGQSVREFNLTG